MPTVQEIMTTELSTLSLYAPIEEAARLMRDEDIDDVVVINDEGSIIGLVTDRDITIRAIADGRDAHATPVGDICRGELIAARPDQQIGEVARMMHDRAVRSIPVVEGDRAVGVVSLGDLGPDRIP
jgi:CBS domain-containing protein